MTYPALAPQERSHSRTRASLGNAELSPRLAQFLSGDPDAREQLPALLRGKLLTRLRVRPAHLDPDLHAEVEQRTWELLLLKAPSSFDPTRGSAITYLRPIALTAVRDVRASYAPPGCRTRPQRDEEGQWEERLPTLSLHDPIENAENETLSDLIADPTDEIEPVIRILSGEQLFDFVRKKAPPQLAQALCHIYKNNMTFQLAAETVGLSREQLKHRIGMWVRKQQELGCLDANDLRSEVPLRHNQHLQTF